MIHEEGAGIKRRRGIYLLPNLFTVAALFAGFYAIVAGTKNHFEEAAIAIYVAMILDGLDGRIARLTHSQSEFGAQLDSMSDMVCFGITPALVMYSWSLHALGKPGWLAAFIYAVCTALRLARFNSQSQQKNKRYFQGLATPASAGLVASIIWVSTKFGLSGVSMALPIAIVAILLGLLKVSTMRYRSFKDLDLRGKVPFLWILGMVLVFVFISFDPPDMLLAIFLVYVLSGPFSTIWGLRKRKQGKKIKKQRSKKG